MTNILLLIFVGVIFGIVFWLRSIEGRKVAEILEKLQNPHPVIPAHPPVGGRNLGGMTYEASLSYYVV